MREFLWLFLLGLVDAYVIYLPDRLPASVRPISYDLTINASLELPFFFNGRVEIKIECSERTRNVVLHAKDLSILSTGTKLMDEKNISVPIYRQFVIANKDFLIFELGKELKRGATYVLHIPFLGAIRNGPSGFYKTSYIDSETSTVRWMGSTQFASVAARTAFPCFDEPAFKATFKIRLGHDKQLKAVSNMPLLETTPMEGNPNWVWDQFDISKRMSTYLVAYFIGDFASLELESFNRLPLKFWSRKEIINQTKQALSIGGKSLSFFEQYFDTPYPLPKQDMIAIPNFENGAMENWGLVMFRETMVVMNDSAGTVAMATTVAQEIAHQWFGNLVTMSWWYDLWLNEGFSAFAASLAVDKMFPEWKYMDRRILESLMSLFPLDALDTSHTVSYLAEDTADVNQMFDPIFYQKGEVLLHMMNSILGEESFRSGVTAYLKAFAYGNAQQDDLWKYLNDEASKKGSISKNLTVKTIMDSWTKQKGYPVVKVIRDYQTGAASLTQVRYSRTESVKKKNPACWNIPISYATQGESELNTTGARTWLECSQRQAFIKKLNPDNWIILNLGLRAPYRVNYDEKNWNLISRTLSSKHEEIPVMNRAQILIDSIELGFKGELGYRTVLNIFSYLGNEKSYLPWLAGLKAMSEMSTLLRRTTKYGQLKSFMQKVLDRIYSSFGFISTGSSDIERAMFESFIVEQAYKYNVNNSKTEARKLYDEWSASTDPMRAETIIPQERKKIVYCEGVEFYGEKAWLLLAEKLREAPSPNEKAKLIYALGCAKEPYLIEKFLEMLSEPGTGIGQQDVQEAFNALLQQDNGFYFARSFLEKNVNDLMINLAPTVAGRLLESLAKHISSEAEKMRFFNFIGNNKLVMVPLRKSIEQCKELAENNDIWTRQSLKEVGRELSRMNFNRPFPPLRLKSRKRRLRGRKHHRH